MDCGAYLLDFLCSAGYVAAGFNGPQALTSTDIKHWQAVTKTWLTGWEGETLAKLSSDYAAMYHKARDPACESPIWEDDQDRIEAERQRVVDYFESL